MHTCYDLPTNFAGYKFRVRLSFVRYKFANLYRLQIRTCPEPLRRLVELVPNKFAGANNKVLCKLSANLMWA